VEEEMESALGRKEPPRIKKNPPPIKNMHHATASRVSLRTKNRELPVRWKKLMAGNADGT